MIEQHLCRCCHSEGKFKSLISTDPLMEDELLYLDALRFCLDIELCLVEGSLAYAACTICETCVSRLQEACSFRRQVLSCEGRFQTLYSQNRIKVTKSEPVVKEELSDLDDFQFEDIFDRDENSLSIKESQWTPAALIRKRRARRPPASTDNENKPKSPRELPKEERSKIYKLYPEEAMKSAVTAVMSKRMNQTDAANRYKVPQQTLGAKLRDIKKKPKEKSKKPKPPRVCQDIKKERKKRFYFNLVLDSDYKQTGDKFTCIQCSKTISNFHNLRRHITKHRLAVNKYKCTVCNTKLPTNVEFVKHKLDEHSIDDRVKCNACDKVFNTKSALIKHKNRFHMLGKKCKCPQCDYECFGLEAMYGHKLTHKKVKDKHCKYCKKSFVRGKTLITHERIHTGDKRKVCAECGQAFVQKASLNYHMMKYHPEVNY